MQRDQAANLHLLRSPHPPVKRGMFSYREPGHTAALAAAGLRMAPALGSPPRGRCAPRLPQRTLPGLAAVVLPHATGRPLHDEVRLWPADLALRHAADEEGKAEASATLEGLSRVARRSIAGAPDQATATRNLAAAARPGQRQRELALQVTRRVLEAARSPHVNDAAARQAAAALRGAQSAAEDAAARAQGAAPVHNTHSRRLAAGLGHVCAGQEPRSRANSSPTRATGHEARGGATSAAPWGATDVAMAAARQAAEEAAAGSAHPEAEPASAGVPGGRCFVVAGGAAGRLQHAPGPEQGSPALRRSAAAAAIAEQTLAVAGGGRPGPLGSAGGGIVGGSCAAGQASPASRHRRLAPALKAVRLSWEDAVAQVLPLARRVAAACVSAKAARAGRGGRVGQQQGGAMGTAHPRAGVSAAQAAANRAAEAAAAAHRQLAAQRALLAREGRFEELKALPSAAVTRALAEAAAAAAAQEEDDDADEGGCLGAATAGLLPTRAGRGTAHEGRRQWVLTGCGDASGLSGRAGRGDISGGAMPTSLRAAEPYVDQRPSQRGSKVEALPRRAAGRRMAGERKASGPAVPVATGARTSPERGGRLSRERLPLHAPRVVPGTQSASQRVRDTRARESAKDVSERPFKHLAFKTERKHAAEDQSASEHRAVALQVRFLTQAAHQRADREHRQALEKYMKSRRNWDHDGESASVPSKRSLLRQSRQDQLARLSQAATLDD